MESVLTLQKKNLKPCPESVDHYSLLNVVFSFPVLISSFRHTVFVANILDGSVGFDGLQDGDDLALSETGFAQGTISLVRGLSWKISSYERLSFLGEGYSGTVVVSGLLSIHIKSF